MEVVRPKETLIVLAIFSEVTFIAERTWDGSSFPVEQADPEEIAIFFLDL